MRWIIVIAIFALFGIASWTLNGRLKSAHRETWERLGHPELFANSFEASIKVTKFLFSQEYRSLNDRYVATCVWVMRALIGALIVSSLVLAKDTTGT